MCILVDHKSTLGTAHDPYVRKSLIIICMKISFLPYTDVCFALSIKSIPPTHHPPTPHYDTAQQFEDKARTGRVQMPVNGRANCEKRFNIAHII